jgi:hypothetical protein
MEPTDFPAASDTPYRLPSRHPSAGRGKPSSSEGAHAEGPSRAATGGAGNASEIKRRQEALLLTYLLYRPGR